MKPLWRLLFCKSVPEISPTFKLMYRLFRDNARVHRGSYLTAFLLMGMSAAATGWCVALLRPVVNGMIIVDDDPYQRFQELRFLAFSVAILYLLRGLATFGQHILMARAGNQIVASLQRRLYTHLLQQGGRFFQDRHSSDFIARLSMGAQDVRNTIQSLISGLGRDLLTLIAVMGVMFYHDPGMALIVTLIFPVAGFWLRRIIRRIRQAARRSFDGSARIMEIMQETIQGMRVIKAFNLEPLMIQRMHQSIREVENSANRMARGLASSSPMTDTLGGLSVAAIILYGGWRVTLAHSDPGAFFAFIGALLLSYEPAKRLSRLNLDVQNGLVGGKLIYEILDSAYTEQIHEAAPSLAVTSGTIHFEKVSFAYRPNEIVLSDLTFTAEPYVVTALVGPSGGGKTTILSLIQRFFDPTTGTIYMDGQNIRLVNVHSLREKIAFVAQDVFLFRGTIRENIALGRLTATKEEIINAAKKAHAHEFILHFAQGYETNVGEQGAQLSGGQKQRIAIARAILKDAPIILLDEPTAALDAESEQEVKKALRDLCVGRTTLVVAHRLQTIVNADRICVIQEGQAHEIGTHEELMQRKGSYYDFFLAQFGKDIAF